MTRKHLTQLFVVGPNLFLPFLLGRCKLSIVGRAQFGAGIEGACDSLIDYVGIRVNLFLIDGAFLFKPTRFGLVNGRLDLGHLVIEARPDNPTGTKGHDAYADALQGDSHHFVVAGGLSGGLGLGRKTLGVLHLLLIESLCNVVCPISLLRGRQISLRG